MRLQSVTIRNYRLHRELSVEFDAARTVIGGPNETGKSTLVEAMHRALFLKAKGASETHRSMRSQIHAGHPEVELAFEDGGTSYRLLKRFSGPNGTTTLTPAGGRALHGDAAEAELARLLGVDGGAGGREAQRQWSHLWVWQGQAGTDPTDHANRERDTLLARLQDGHGEGAAMQSELDARVAGRLAGRYFEIFNRNGSAKKDSPLARAQEDAARARERLEQACEAGRRLEGAVRDFETAEAGIASASGTLAKLLLQQKEVVEKLAEAADLQAAEKAQAHLAEEAAEKYRVLQQTDQRIVERRSDLQRRGAELAPVEAETHRLVEAEEVSRRQHSEAEDAARRAADAERATRLRHELAGAWGAHFGHAAQADQLRKRGEEVEKIRAERKEIESALAKLPAITTAQLRTLETLGKNRERAETTLAAMAAGIEVLAADVPVTIGEASLDAGRIHVLTEDTEIVLGERIRLRITPGGGTSLAEARRNLHEAKQALQRELDARAVSSTADAAEASLRRQQFEVKADEARSKLDFLGAASLDADLAAAEKARATIEGEIQRRTAMVEAFVPPKSAGEATGLLASAERELREAEERRMRDDAERDKAGGDWRESATRLSTHRETLQERRDELHRLQTEVNVLEQTCGNDDARRTALDELQRTKVAAETELARTRDRLAKLQPGVLAREREACARSIDETQKAKHEAETKLAVARSMLHNDGTADPEGALAFTAAEEQAAGERLEIATRHAAALTRLHTLFGEEQRALAEQFTRPLADKVSGYLQCLFGAGARAQMGIEENAFAALALVRTDDFPGSFPFETLSGGAKEQVAAAVRLGMAEVLAAGHGGCLPVIFDDAFAYSDPARVQTLQRMLDLAAHRGLQIIVLTCNPGDYAALGARQVSLRAESPLGIAPAPNRHEGDGPPSNE